MLALVVVAGVKVDLLSCYGLHFPAFARRSPATALVKHDLVGEGRLSLNKRSASRGCIHNQSKPFGA